jgi:hypothetical protein
MKNVSSACVMYNLFEKFYDSSKAMKSTNVRCTVIMFSYTYNLIFLFFNGAKVLRLG